MANIYLTNNNMRKKRIKRRVLITIISLITLIIFFLAGILIASFVKANRVMSQESADLSPFATNILPPYRSVSFNTRDGQINLRGWWMASQGDETVATVIMVHSQGMNRLPFGLDSVDLYRSFTNSGCNVLSFDLRNSGESGGELSSFGYTESEDVLAALSYVELSTPRKPIILYGLGTGTTAILRAMADLEDYHNSTSASVSETNFPLPEPERISALILDTVTRSSDNYISAEMASQKGPGKYIYPTTVPYLIRLSAGNKDKQDYLSYLSQIPIPVMLVGYEHDNFLAENAYKSLWTERFRLHPSLSQSFTAKGYGHLDAYLSETSAYCKAIEDFIFKYF